MRTLFASRCLWCYTNLLGASADTKARYIAYRHFEHHIWRYGVYSPTCWPSPSFSIIHHLRISITLIIKTHQIFLRPTDKMIHKTNELKEFKRNLLPWLAGFVDNIMTEKNWKKFVTHDKSVQKINFHLDHQGVSVLPWMSYPLGIFSSANTCPHRPN